MARSEIFPLVALKGRPQCTNVLFDISFWPLGSQKFTFCDDAIMIISKFEMV